MRWLRIASAIVTIVCSVAASSGKEPSTDSAENFIKDWVATVNMNDPEKLMAFYDRSEETEVIVSSGLRHRGYRAIEQAYRDDFEQVRFYDSTPEEITTRILGDTALVTFEHLFNIHVTTDGSRWQVHIRTTSVLHRFENEWKIVLEHSSPIQGVDRMTQIED